MATDRADVGIRGVYDCPECGADWRAGEIAGQPGEFYSRLIGCIWDDHIQEWLCPDCGARWNRWTGEPLDRRIAPTRRNPRDSKGENG